MLTFFENLLGEHPYFGSDRLTLADIVAGTVIPGLPGIGVSMGDYLKLSAWSERLSKRATWQMTQTSPEVIEAYKSRRQQFPIAA
ncbi:glutathione S-transferase family protein [Coleofasciculus sp. H7-2]|uniref:glutathione S-transferase family protein n=1 Tax=Coleofasciculus sp. H7-2 TaxID=3351545 RepID=UPI00366FE9E9